MAVKDWPVEPVPPATCGVVMGQESESVLSAYANCLLSRHTAWDRSLYKQYPPPRYLQRTPICSRGCQKLPHIHHRDFNNQDPRPATTSSLTVHPSPSAVTLLLQQLEVNHINEQQHHHYSHEPVTTPVCSLWLAQPPRVMLPGVKTPSSISTSSTAQVPS